MDTGPLYAANGDLSPQSINARVGWAGFDISSRGQQAKQGLCQILPRLNVIHYTFYTRNGPGPISNTQRPVGQQPMFSDGQNDVAIIALASAQSDYAGCHHHLLWLSKSILRHDALPSRLCAHLLRHGLDDFLQQTASCLMTADGNEGQCKLAIHAIAAAWGPVGYASCHPHLHWTMHADV